MIRKCIICGCDFTVSPSTNKITCSKKCSSIRKSKTHMGEKNYWGQASREKARTNAAKTGNLKNGTIVAQRNPKNRRGPQNRESKIWYLIAPNGETETVVNLQDWARRHAKDYFGMEPSDHDAAVIASGIRQIKQSMEGKRYRKGKPSPISTYKGWSLLGWEDKKESTD